MKILLMGGTGAMGHPLSKILSRKHEVYVTSRHFHEDSAIHYIQGDAHDLVFLKSVLQIHFDVVVDFMIYHLNELQSRIDLLLNSSNQYIFLSSCRVFANTEPLIDEDSPRLLDVVSDQEYLATHEYALEKAREENLLFSHPKKNWTIVRPYITYNENRLQLGFFEKEHWLYRALHGKSVVFARTLCERFTTLTSGDDVARAISLMAGNADALGEAVNVVSTEYMSWGEILKIYEDEFEMSQNTKLKLQILEDTNTLTSLFNNEAQAKYDRLLNRKFSATKLNRIIKKEFVFTDTRVGLAGCLKSFLSGPEKFDYIPWRIEAGLDSITNEYQLNHFPSLRDQIKYTYWRFLK